MRKLIVGNWKMHPDTYAEADRIFRAILPVAKKYKTVQVVLCPPFPWLTDLSHKNPKALAFGAQDVFWAGSGPFTGEVSPMMLKSSKVKYAIVGHSERRHWLGETDRMINWKVRAAIAEKLTVILCVGESALVRKRGVAASKIFIKDQLRRDLAGLSPREASEVVIAYEPIWAIGTGVPDTSEDVAEMASFIKASLHAKPRARSAVLYGGSLNGANAGKFLTLQEIDGALVGGASVDHKEFEKIIKITAQK